MRSRDRALVLTLGLVATNCTAPTDCPDCHCDCSGPGEPTAVLSRNPPTPVPEAEPQVQGTATLERVRELYDRQELAEAWTELEKVLDREPTNPEALTLRALIELERTDYDAALATATLALVRDRDQASAWIVVAVTEQERGRLDTALPAYRRYLDLAPNGRYAESARKQVEWLERRK